MLYLNKKHAELELTDKMMLEITVHAQLELTMMTDPVITAKLVILLVKPVMMGQVETLNV